MRGVWLLAFGSIAWIGVLAIATAEAVELSSQFLGTSETNPLSSPSLQPTTQRLIPTPTPASAPTHVLANASQPHSLEPSNQEFVLSNETHVFEVTNFEHISRESPLFVQFRFKLRSEETAELFDDPALVVSVDDEPLYQVGVHEIECSYMETYCESAWHTATLLISTEEVPKLISIWCGDTGDQLQPTTCFVSVPHIYVAQKTIQLVVSQLTDVFVTRDSDQLLTVEWNSPLVSDTQLDRALRYDIRVSAGEIPFVITDNEWEQLLQPEILLPKTGALLSKSPQSFEQRLIRVTPVDEFLAIRASDWQGNLGPVAVVRIPPHISGSP